MALREIQIPLTLRVITICLVVLSLTGCQSMMTGKSKSKDPYGQDKFSCGEALPGQRQASVPQPGPRR